MNAMPRQTSRAKGPIRIGLVNNMPDAALVATERQFKRLLESARCEFGIDIRLFYLPEIARGDAAQVELQARYAPIDTLPEAGVDGLIVTGCEPVRSSLADEPYYPSLTRLIDWAKDNTVSTIWSCLAAHAAVLHLDDIRRQKLPRKLTGVYEFERTSNHALLRGIVEPVGIAHSRLNGLAAGELVAHGYELLTHSDEAGVDAFVKKYRSLFIFLQGHPEYEPDTLYREYRRDMTRYLTGKQPTCPALPENYFERHTAVALDAFAEEVRSAGTIELLGRIPAIEAVRLNRTASQAAAARLFSNWTAYIAEAKARQGHRSREPASV
jgi:homoserine O-succinyltransferase/O-acetyltransferase